MLDAHAVLRNRSLRAAFFGYHSVASEGPQWLSLPPELFERQLHGLSLLGLRTGGSEELSTLAAGRRLGRPTAFLTFDDGFRDNYTNAYPLLRAARAKAIVFILPPAVDCGGPLSWPEVAEDVKRHPTVMRSLDWEMIDEMAAGGIEFGSHGLTHAAMTSLSDDELRDELVDSRRRIRDRLGRCDALAYPFGFWDERVASAAADAGYRFAFTMPGDAQRGAHALAIPRVPVDRRDGLARFGLKLLPGARSIMLSGGRAPLRRARDFGTRVARSLRGPA